MRCDAMWCGVVCVGVMWYVVIRAMFRYCQLLEREAAQMVRTQHNIQKLKKQHLEKAPSY
jgi:proline racemase